MNFSRSMKLNINDNFDPALVEAGGIESVLIYFADIIRREKDCHNHSLAFSVLLKMTQINMYHLNKFLDELDGLKLIEFILVHPKCIISKPLLENYMDFCFVKKGQHCFIKSSKLAHHLLNTWRAWHKDLRVARLLYRRLIRLLQPSGASKRSHHDERKLENYYIHHNFRMLTEAGGIDILMGILRECLVPLDENAPNINYELVELIVNLISLLIKHPPGLDVMLDIMEFLLFLHPDPKAYVEVKSDKTLYLHPVSIYDNQDVNIDEETPNRTRTPSSDRSQSFRTSVESLDQTEPQNSTSHINIGNNLSHATLKSATTDDDSFRSLENPISKEYSDSLAKFIEQYNIDLVYRPPNLMSDKLVWNQQKFSKHSYHLAADQLNTNESSEQIQRSGNRNFAIASMADMLASIVKLISTDPMKILSEALQKPIIDLRKLIILANNHSSLVREKVLRLFLYCIRACYFLNLKSVLNKYEQESKSSNFKICVPIQLMAHQLLRYPTTIKMIQLCYGIIVGIDDFETVEAVCLVFDIETINNHLQLNTLVLLIQLMTQLQSSTEILQALEFVYAYMKQLLQLGQESTVSVLIKGNLVDSLMKIYFNYVKHEININDSHKNNRKRFRQARQNDTEIRGYKRVIEELDKLLIFIVRYYIQYQTTNETIKSIDDLLLYFDMLNTCVSAKYQHLLRDRKVKVLMTGLKYCKHYEDCARRKIYGGRVQYYLKSFFKNTELNRFNNILSDSKFNQILSDDSDHQTVILKNFNDDCRESLAGHIYNQKEFHANRDNGVMSNGSNENSSKDNREQSDDDEDDYDYDAHLESAETEGLPIKEISEADVLDRFKATIEFVVNFIITKEAGVIPSPLERRFIMKCVRLFSHHLHEYKQLATKRPFNGITQQRSHWSLMLAKLEPSIRGAFSRVILFLLSPCDSMNLDERKYYAHQLLEMFSVDQMLNLLNGGDSSRPVYRVLIVFINDLIDFNRPSLNSEDSTSDQDEDLLDDVENKLMLLANGIKQQLGLSEANKATSSYSDQLKRSVSGEGITQLDTKFRNIWLADLVQQREDVRERLHRLKTDNQVVSPSKEEKFTDEFDKLLDEAANITREFVNDKHEQRKIYLEDLKQNKIYNYHIRQQWLSLIIGNTHERSIWCLDDYYPKSWELNPVEGPSRTRRRLRPCKLALESRFLRCNTKKGHHMNQLNHHHHIQTSRSIWQSCEDEYKSTSPEHQPDESIHQLLVRTSSQTSDVLADDWYNQYSPHPLCSMVMNSEQSMDSNELRIRMFTTDRIHFNCDCSIIRPSEVCEGEVSIASWCIHFIGERSKSQQQVNDCLSLSSHQHHINRMMNQTSGSPITGASSTPTKTVNRSKHNTSLATLKPYVSTIVEDLWFDEIVEIWDRRYQLQDVGLEIFLTNNMTYLMSFKSNRDREDFKQHLMREEHKMINLQKFNPDTSLNRLTQLWRDGKLTNFDYLTCLNKFAGRSFNDLMQYPIFPFVLANYTSNTLDLNLASNFRKLNRPMAIQNEEREATFKNNYQFSQSSNLSVGPCSMNKPYHYSNHYSNSATVLHFLVRLPPFTQMLIQYQDNNFDQPDRTFHSIANTWQLITRDSNTDFKELIPEFFFLPEMFINIEQLELGRKQNNELVNDVKLPPWCPDQDARLFTLIHRQALESSYVSENLHHWIDLVFGYKQTGKSAIDAINVFHPATYYGEIDLNNQPSGSASIGPTMAALSARLSTYSSDYISTMDLQNCQSTSSFITANNSENGSPKKAATLQHCKSRHQHVNIERLALETMIKTYGQMPKQLFSQPMKQRSFSTFVDQLNGMRSGQKHHHHHQQQQQQAHLIDSNGIKRHRKMEPLKQVRGLKWGSFVGSPNDSHIIVVRHKHIVSGNKQVNQTKNSKSSLQDAKSSFDQPNVKFHLCLLVNGDVAVLKHNTSLMLDYRADRKSGGTNQFSGISSRYSRRAGLSNVARMNLFSNMIISRQQFSFAEPVYLSESHSDSFQKRSPTLVSPTGSRSKFSPESLSLVQWDNFIDGTIRIKHPATSNQKPIIPLVQANTIVDSMTTCASVPELNLLLVGYNSGAICAHIISTSYEIESTIIQHNSSGDISSSNVSTNTSSAPPTTSALSANSPTPSAADFLHTATSSASDPISSISLGPAKVNEKSLSLTEEPHLSLPLAPKNHQSVRSLNKTTKWLYCHSGKINSMKINVSFGIVVTGSDDGTSVIWDLNSLTYVRTIDYKYQSLRWKNDGNDNQSSETLSGACSWTFGRASCQEVSDYLCNCNNQAKDAKSAGVRHQSRERCCICGSGVNLIAISDTLGDIVSVKDFNNRLVMASDQDDDQNGLDDETKSTTTGLTSSFGSTQASDPANYLTSMIYVHTINGSLVGFVNCHTQVTAVCYSNAPEGISVNVIVVGLSDGLVRLYNSWDLSRVKEFRVSGLSSPISSLLYSRDSQLLYVAYEDGQLVVLRNKKKGSISLPKEWYL